MLLSLESPLPFPLYFFFSAIFASAPQIYSFLYYFLAQLQLFSSILISPLIVSENLSVDEDYQVVLRK